MVSITTSLNPYPPTSLSRLCHFVSGDCRHINTPDCYLNPLQRYSGGQDQFPRPPLFSAQANMWPFSPSTFKVVVQSKLTERSQALENPPTSSASDSVYLSASGKFPTILDDCGDSCAPFALLIIHPSQLRQLSITSPVGSGRPRKCWRHTLPALSLRRIPPIA